MTFSISIRVYSSSPFFSIPILLPTNPSPNKIKQSTFKYASHSLSLSLSRHKPKDKNILLFPEGSKQHIKKKKPVQNTPRGAKRNKKREQKKGGKKNQKNAPVKGGRKGSSLVLLKKRQGRRNRWDHDAHVVQQQQHHHPHHHHHHQQQQQQKNKLSKTSLRLPKEKHNRNCLERRG
jgi:hypothetical protein